MTFKQTRGLWLWASALMLVLAAILPLSTGWRVVWALGIAMVLVRVWRRHRRHAAIRRQSGGMSGLGGLPPASYRQPIVLVCGDGLTGLFDNLPLDALALRTVEQGCYVRVASIEQLPTMIADLMARRPGWHRQLCVMFVCNPGEHRDAAVLAARIRTFGNQLALIRKRGVALPLLLVSYLQAARSEGPWFSWEAAESGPRVHDAGANSSLADWQRQPTDAVTRARRLQACIHLDSAVAWLSEALQPAFAMGKGRYCAGLAAVAGITLIPTLPGEQESSLWQRWLQDRTALSDTRCAWPEAHCPLPFPDPLLPLLSAHASAAPVHRASGVAIWLFAFAAAVALVSSAWQNTLLARQVSDDLRRYLSLSRSEHLHPPQLAQREEAMAVLRQDAHRLDTYYRHGAPPALGLGLYRGEQLRTPLLALIAAYRQPSPRPAAVDPIRLDSLSLFSSGSAQLKPESAKVLINVLVNIKAQPDWLIVVGGHTDATGDAGRNLRLSRARAASVRDWIQRMGDIPDSCLAVQGFGASQPIASNDTEAGRTINRRVDIRLVPAQGACVLPSSAPNRQSPVALRGIHDPREGASHGNSDLPLAER